MRYFYSINKLLIATILGLLSCVAFADGAKVTPLMHQELDGLSNKDGMMLVVEYGPGTSSHKHRHDAYSFVYVLEGIVVMQVAGREPVTLEAGETFYESPHDVHLISKNASNTETAKFVVFSVKEKDSPLVIPVR